MHENTKNEIVVSIGPNLKALITMDDGEIKNARKMGCSDGEICEMARCCSNALATGIIPQTQKDIDDFCGFHDAHLPHSLSDYPVAGI